jgi:hypothetical protein
MRRRLAGRPVCPAPTLIRSLLSLRASRVAVSGRIGERQPEPEDYGSVALVGRARAVEREEQLAEELHELRPRLG